MVRLKSCQTIRRLLDRPPTSDEKSLRPFRAKPISCVLN